MLEKYKDAKYIFVVGIGGSDLASKAVWHAMTLHKIEPNKPISSVGKKLFFLESPDAYEYTEVDNFVKNEITNLAEIVLIVISKSGKTVETLETFHKIYDILSKKFGKSVDDRAIIISTLDSPLWQIAEEKNLEKIEWPARQAGIAGGEGDIGGRFSAFTSVHTTILTLAGLNVAAFQDGGNEMRVKCQAEDSPAKHLAQNIFDNYKNEVNILDFFIFNSELEDLGKWCRQLIAESLALITPTVSIGPVDLHSMLELYLGGPKNRFTIFIRSLREIQNSINESAYLNVTEAYDKAGLHFIKYEMSEINEKELGSFMAFMITTTKELAQLLGIDPYGQPAVEKYKSEIQSTKSEIN